MSVSPDVNVPSRRRLGLVIDFVFPRVATPRCCSAPPACVAAGVSVGVGVSVSVGPGGGTDGAPIDTPPV